jgi:hypothetical protein
MGCLEAEPVELEETKRTPDSIHRSVPFGIELMRGAVGARGDTGESPEFPGEVTLIGVACLVRDHRERERRTGQHVGAPLDSPAPGILADRDTNVLAEDPGHVHDVHASSLGKLIESHTLPEFVVHLVTHSRQPRWWRPSRLAARRSSRAPGEYLDCIPFNHQCVEWIGGRKFRRNPFGERGDLTIGETMRFVEKACTRIEEVGRGRIGFEHDNPGARVVKPVGMHHTRWFNLHIAGKAFVILTGNALLPRSCENDGEKRTGMRMRVERCVRWKLCLGDTDPARVEVIVRRAAESDRNVRIGHKRTQRERCLKNAPVAEGMTLASRMPLVANFREALRTRIVAHSP